VAKRGITLSGQNVRTDSFDSATNSPYNDGYGHYTNSPGKWRFNGDIPSNDTVTKTILMATRTSQQNRHGLRHNQIGQRGHGRRYRLANGTDHGLIQPLVHGRHEYGWHSRADKCKLDGQWKSLAGTIDGVTTTSSPLESPQPGWHSSNFRRLLHSRQPDPGGKIYVSGKVRLWCRAKST
jgi:hypothetical protein